MAKLDVLSYLLGINNFNLNRNEKAFLEGFILTVLYRELIELFMSPYKNYFKLIKHLKEEAMFQANFIREMVKDILSTNEYSLAGIAIQTHIPEDVLFDIVAGLNTNPTLESSRKLFELHLEVRRSLYEKIIEKIIYNLIALKEKKQKNKEK